MLHAKMHLETKPHLLIAGVPVVDMQPCGLFAGVLRCTLGGDMPDVVLRVSDLELVQRFGPRLVPMLVVKRMLKVPQ